MANRAFTRVTRFDVQPRSTAVPAGTMITLTEQWTAGRFRGQLQSARLHLVITVDGWSGTPLPAHLVMPPHGAEATRRHGVEFISNKLIEVRPAKLKGHGVGRLYLNAMVAWAQRYHWSEMLVPIETSRPEPIGSKLIGFYDAFGISFAAGSTTHAKVSTPVPVRLLKYVAMPHLQLHTPPVLTWHAL